MSVRASPAIVNRAPGSSTPSLRIQSARASSEERRRPLGRNPQPVVNLRPVSNRRIRLAVAI
jgi:hypothetical protein